ncbi:MAG TPA: hypothetical protein VEJ87_13505 [Acidimicrobiales bacterium]|nr:hypothetical protein [Acidimicrobiales bacterium]
MAAGWRAALEADDWAARTSNPDDPMLAATHAEPQLGVIVASVAWYRANGWVGIGTDRILRISVSDVANGRANVTACIDGEEIEVNAVNGHPAPGIPGEAGPTTFRALMIQTPSGWKIEQQTATEEACPWS